MGVRTIRNYKQKQMIREAFNKIKTRVINPGVQWENEYIEPKNGVNHGDRKHYFTNYNKDLVDRISEIKKAES